MQFDIASLVNCDGRISKYIVETMFIITPNDTEPYNTTQNDMLQNDVKLCRTKISPLMAHPQKKSPKRDGASTWEDGDSLGGIGERHA